MVFFDITGQLLSKLNTLDPSLVYLDFNISHFHLFDPLSILGVVPEVHQHVGVEGEHDAEGDHIDSQEHG